jgi:hypothetical protein
VRWTLGEDCNYPCPIFMPNDNCADAILITSGPIYTGSTLNATKDGPGMGCEQSCGGQCNTAPDLWYRWVSGPFPSQTTFDMCYPILGYNNDATQVDSVNYPTLIYRYDAMMLVYDGCPGTGGNAIVGGCNDDGCGAGIASTVSRIVINSVNANTTFWIRISGWSGAAGNFTLRVNQP